MNQERELENIDGKCELEIFSTVDCMNGPLGTYLLY